MQGHAEAVAERLQIAGICLVMDILHTDMQGFDGEIGDMNPGTAGEKLQQTKGVLATRQADEDFIVLVDELVLSQRLVKSLPKSFLERHLLLHKHQIDGTDNQEECQDVIPMQMGALEHDVGYDAENGQRDALLNDLQLDEIERTAVFDKTETIGGNLATVFEESDTPREDDDPEERPVAAGT